MIAGNPLLVPHVVAICMVAMEAECLRDNETSKLTANKELDIALNSFTSDDGFSISGTAEVAHKGREGIRVLSSGTIPWEMILSDYPPRSPEWSESFCYGILSTSAKAHSASSPPRCAPRADFRED